MRRQMFVLAASILFGFTASAGTTTLPMPNGKSMSTLSPQPAAAPQNPWSQALPAGDAASPLRQNSELLPASAPSSSNVPAAIGSRPTPGSGIPPAFSLTCVGGGGMRAAATPDGIVRIVFVPAAQGSLTASPRPGQCAWHDRGFRPGEPPTLEYDGGGRAAHDLVGTARRGQAFEVQAYNNGQGEMVVTRIGEVPAGRASAPVSGTSTVSLPPQVPSSSSRGLNWSSPPASALSPSILHADFSAPIANGGRAANELNPQPLPPGPPPGMHKLKSTVSPATPLSPAAATPASVISRMDQAGIIIVGGRNANATNRTMTARPPQSTGSVKTESNSQ